MKNSKISVDDLAALGREVVNVDGGVMAWEQAGLDMERGANGG